jgi:hypothetical protein
LIISEVGTSWNTKKKTEKLKNKSVLRTSQNFTFRARLFLLTFPKTEKEQRTNAEKRQRSVVEVSKQSGQIGHLKKKKRIRDYTTSRGAEECTIINSQRRGIRQIRHLKEWKI